MTMIEKDPKASGEEEAKLPHKKRRKTDQEDAAAEEEDEADADTEPRMSRSIDREGMPKARVVRLEQNRKAARESRRRGVRRRCATAAKDVPTMAFNMVPHLKHLKPSEQHTACAAWKIKTRRVARAPTARYSRSPFPYP